ncbi:BglG family transcription antiterminator [Enterococcus sp. LJL99]
MLVNRWYQILNTLLLSQTVSLSELCQKTGFSKHKIKSSVEMINDQLTNIAEIKQLNDEFQLQIIDSQQFTLVMAGTLKRESDFNSSSKRIAFVINKLLAHEYVIIDDLAEETGVSSSTMKKDIKELKFILQEYEMALHGVTNKGLQITGNEVNIRLLLINHVFDFFPDFFAQSQNVDEVLFSFCESLGVDQINAALLKKSLLVSLKRMDQKQTIATKFLFYPNEAIDRKQVEELFFEIELLFERTLSNSEKEFIQYPLYINNFKQISLKEVDQIQLQTVFYEMMEAVQNEYFIEIDKDLLFNELKFHLMMLMNRLLFYSKPTDIFLNEFSMSYPFAYKIASVAMGQLGKIIHREPSKTEISYLAIYFELFLQKKYQVNKQTVAIVANVSAGVIALIKQQVRDVIGKETEIVQYSEEQALKTNFDVYSLVFSTIPLDQQVTSTVVIRIANLFNGLVLNNDWLNLYTTNAVSLSQQPIYLKKLNEAENYETNLAEMIGILEQQALVDQEFRTRIEKLDRKKANFYHNKIAFPHTINQKNDQIVLFIATSKKEISFQQEKIQAIILLAIPETVSGEMETELLVLYDFIFKIMENESLKQQLLAVDSTQELIKMLKTGGII